MQRSLHGTAGATANDFQAQSSQPSIPRRVNFNFTRNDRSNWQQDTVSPAIPYCDVAALQPKRGHGSEGGEPSRANSRNHSRRRWAELRALARNSLVTLESARKGTSSVSSSSTPAPPSPQKAHSPGPKSPLGPSLKSTTSLTFAPQLPPPAPVPPPPRTPRRTAWRRQVAPSLPTLVEVSSAASGGKSDNTSRVSKSGKSGQSNRGRSKGPRAGRGARNERYEMEKKRRTRESGSKVSPTSIKNAHYGRPNGANRYNERSKRGPGIDENNSELSDTSKSSCSGRNIRVTKAKDTTKDPPRPPLTRRDALLEAMRVDEPPAPPLTSSSVYSSSECSSPSIYTSSSVYSSSTATPASPATSTERISPPSTPTSKRKAYTEPTSYTPGSETASPPKTPLTPTSPTKTVTSQTMTEMESEAESARTETVADTASSTHRTVSSVALGSALGLTKPSSAVRSVLGLEEGELPGAIEFLIGETSTQKDRKLTEDREEEKVRRREGKKKEEAVESPPPSKPRPRVRKRKQARFPEPEGSIPTKDLKKTTSDPGERYPKLSSLRNAEERPRRDHKDSGSSSSSRKRETTQKPSTTVEKENKSPESLDGEVEVSRRQISHNIKSRRSVCVRGQGMNLYIDLAHSKPSSTTTATNSPRNSAPNNYHGPTLHDLQNNNNLLQIPSPSHPVAVDDDMTSCVSATSLHPGVNAAHSSNPKNLAFKNPFAPPPPPQQMRYTRLVRQPYHWPRLDRGFDGVGAPNRPPLDLSMSKELPPIPASPADSDYDEEVGRAGATRRQLGGSGSGRVRGPRPLPRRLSLSLSALPDTPFLGALDVSRLAVGEERVFRLPDPPTQAPPPRRQASAPAPSSSGRGAAWATDDDSDAASAAVRKEKTRRTPVRRRTDRGVGGSVRDDDKSMYGDSDAAESTKGDQVNAEVDGIARRLAFAIKNGRAKGTRAVKVSWAVGY